MADVMNTMNFLQESNKHMQYQQNEDTGVQNYSSITRERGMARILEIVEAHKQQLS